MDGYYNPYYPYVPTPGNGGQTYASLKQESVLTVNGYNGANACQMAPNSSRLALDISGTMIWLIVTDGAGYKTITPYDIFDHKEPPPAQTPSVDLSVIEARLSKLEAFVDEFNTPAVAVKSTQSSTSAQPV